MNKILLPNKVDGVFVKLILIDLILIVPFTITLWLSSKIAPLWVCIPLAMSASAIAFLTLVKMN